MISVGRDCMRRNAKCKMRAIGVYDFVIYSRKSFGVNARFAEACYTVSKIGFCTYHIQGPTQIQCIYPDVRWQVRAKVREG